MAKTNITVTLPIEEYDRLRDIEKGFNEYNRMLKRANPDGKSAIFTEELKEKIMEIYC